MNLLAERLRARIDSQGPLTFAEFMGAALYDPELGYYGSGRAAIGRKGDFFTSVSVGPLFGRLLARQFAEMWELLGRPRPFTVAEQGAHDGTLAADVLEGVCQQSPECWEALEYVILEPSEVWRRRQEEKLSVGGKVRWAEVPGEVTGVIFSNELLDAFPVHRLCWKGGGWRELYVQFESGGFTWSEGELSSAEVERAVARLPTALPAGYETDLSAKVEPWLRQAAAGLRRGWLLMIDYGYERADYYSPERAGGTLSAYANHARVDDPLAVPGECDLTAHVDFTTLTELGLAAGLEVAGFTDQHRFLAGVMAGTLREGEPISPRDARAFKTLMHPELLGAAFKVLGLGHGVEGLRLSGFRFGGGPQV